MKVLKRIGIPIVEHCNLNCKGCLHFCNLDQKKFYYDCTEFVHDINRISGIFDDVKVIRLYGGEPLLHPKIIELLEITRQYLHNTKIELLTNGLLLPYMDEKFYHTIINLDVYVRWSSYPVGSEVSAAIEKN